MKSTSGKKSKSPQKNLNTINSAKLPTWTYWLISALAFLLYAMTITYGYVLDDVAVIEQNIFVQKGIRGIPEILSTFYWQGFTDANVGLFRPVSLMMFAIEHELSPDSPFLSHAINIILYALSAGLLLKVLQLWMPSVNPWFFFFVSLLFVVHPIHTEVVANIKSRDEIVAFLFFLLSSYFFYRNVLRRNKDTWIAAFFFFIALLSKEGALLLLPLLVMLEFQNPVSWKKLLISFAPFLVLTFIWLVWHAQVVGQSEITPYSYHDNTLLATSSILEQKATAFFIFLQYEIKAFYPYLMSYDYSYPYFTIIGWSSPLAWLGLFSFFGGLFGIVYFLKKNFLLSFGLALFFFPLLLTGNIFFNIGTTMADRFLYVSVLGAAILLVLGIGFIRKTLPDNTYKPSNIAFILVPLLLGFSIQTILRNSAWESNQTLFTTDYQNAPESARVQYNYAKVLHDLSGDDTSRAEFQQSIDVYENVMRMDSGYVNAAINLGALYIRKKSYSEAKRTFEKGLEFSKNEPLLWGGLGEAQYHLNDKMNALMSMDKAIELGSRQPGVFVIRGTISFEQNNLTEAEQYFKTGLSYEPDNENLLLNIGNVYGALKNFPAALEAFKRLHELDPNNAQVVQFLGIIYNELGQTEEAQKMMDLHRQMVSQK